MQQNRRSDPRGKVSILARRRLWLVLMGMILAIAWFDGGEEPIRQITQPIAVPEGRS